MAIRQRRLRLQEENEHSAINILRKKRQEVTGYEAKVEAEHRAEPPNVFTRVRIHHVVTGMDIAERALEDAIHLSESKYCSVSAMIQLTAAIETTYEIHSC